MSESNLQPGNVNKVLVCGGCYACQPLKFGESAVSEVLEDVYGWGNVGGNLGLLCPQCQANGVPLVMGLKPARLGAGELLPAGLFTQGQLNGFVSCQHCGRWQILDSTSSAALEVLLQNGWQSNAGELLMHNIRSATFTCPDCSIKIQWSEGSQARAATHITSKGDFITFICVVVQGCGDQALPIQIFVNGRYLDSVGSQSEVNQKCIDYVRSKGKK